MEGGGKNQGWLIRGIALNDCALLPLVPRDARAPVKGHVRLAFGEGGLGVSAGIASRAAGCEQMRACVRALLP